MEPCTPEEERTFARVLLKRGVITREQYNAAVVEALEGDQSLIDILAAHGYIAVGDTAPAPPPLPEGEKIGRFILGDLIGRGSLAGVFRAVDSETRATVALKIFKPRAGKFPKGLRQTFVDAALAAAKLEHPNIVRVVGADKEEGRGFVAMELIDGTNLRDHLTAWIKPRDEAWIREMMRLTADVAGALAAAHAAKLVHRAVTPGNILVELRNGEPRAFKLADFGVSVAPKSDAYTDAIKENVGSPSYMSPEQVTGGEVGPASDFFSLGTVLYEIVTGTSPFLRGSPEETANAIELLEPAPPSSINAAVPRALDDLILGCLNKEPGDRYASAAEIGADLRTVAEGRSWARRPSPRPIAKKRK